MTTSLRRVGWLAIALAASSALTPALAQAPLDEVITTAQKREQNLQDVAQSVDIVRGDELDAIARIMREGNGITGPQRTAFGRPDRVVPQLIGGLQHVDEVGRHGPPPVPE